MHFTRDHLCIGKVVEFMLEVFDSLIKRSFIEFFGTHQAQLRGSKLCVPTLVQSLVESHNSKPIEVNGLRRVLLWLGLHCKEQKPEQGFANEGNDLSSHQLLLSSVGHNK